MNYDEIAKHHIGNLHRASGNKGSYKYKYVVDSDDLANAYLQIRDELGYPLMIDSKNRRAIVYNKSGLEQRIKSLIMKEIGENIKALEKCIVTDVVNDIKNELQALTNTANSSKKSRPSSSGMLNSFITGLAKGLAKGVSSIIDDVVTNKDY